MISLSEDRLIRILKDKGLRARLHRHNQRQLSRIYPKGTRFGSTNISAADFTAALQAGCQLIALNFQTWDTAMQLSFALFQRNGGCGYVRRPPQFDLDELPPPPHPSPEAPPPARSRERRNSVFSDMFGGGRARTASSGGEAPAATPARGGGTRGSCGAQHGAALRVVPLEPASSPVLSSTDSEASESARASTGTGRADSRADSCTSSGRASQGLLMPHRAKTAPAAGPPPALATVASGSVSRLGGARDNDKSSPRQRERRFERTDASSDSVDGSRQGSRPPDTARQLASRGGRKSGSSSTADGAAAGRTPRRGSVPAGAVELPDDALLLHVAVLSAQYLPKRDGERLEPDSWDDGEMAGPWQAGRECRYAFYDEQLQSGDIITACVEIEVIGGKVSELPSSQLTPERTGSAASRSQEVTAEMWAHASPSVSRLSAFGPAATANGLLPSWTDARLSCVAWQPEFAFLRLVVYKQRGSGIAGVVGATVGATRVPIAYEVIPLSCLRSGLRSVALRSPTCGSRIHGCCVLLESRQEIWLARVERPLKPPDGPRQPQDIEATVDAVAAEAAAAAIGGRRLQAPRPQLATSAAAEPKRWQLALRTVVAAKRFGDGRPRRSLSELLRGHSSGYAPLSAVESAEADAADEAGADQADGAAAPPSAAPLASRATEGAEGGTQTATERARPPEAAADAASAAGAVGGRAAGEARASMPAAIVAGTEPRPEHCADAGWSHAGHAGAYAASQAAAAELETGAEGAEDSWHADDVLLESISRLSASQATDLARSMLGAVAVAESALTEAEASRLEEESASAAEEEEEREHERNHSGAHNV